MTDLAETIERLRRQLKGVDPSLAVVLAPMHHAALTRLLDAAEAGLRARDAALEECVQLVAAWDIDPKMAESLIAAIRALRRPT